MITSLAASFNPRALTASPAMRRCRGVEEAGAAAALNEAVSPRMVFYCLPPLLQFVIEKIDGTFPGEFCRSFVIAGCGIVVKAVVNIRVHVGRVFFVVFL